MNISINPIWNKGDRTNSLVPYQQNTKPSLIYPYLSADKIAANQAEAETSNGYLLLIEIILSDQTNNYVHSIISILKEKGMMRHNLKRKANNLVASSTDLIKRSQSLDSIHIKEMTKDIYPSLSDDYIQNKGTFIQKIQEIENATIEALNKLGVRNSDLAAKIEMVIMLCQTGIEFYNDTEAKINALMDGRVQKKKSRQNESIQFYAMSLLHDLIGNLRIMEEDEKKLTSLSGAFKMELVKEDMLTLFKSGITSLKIEFIEYVIISLHKKLLHHSISLQDYRTLMFRMGGKNNVRKLLNEISQIDLPDDNEYDFYDLMEMLSETDNGPVIDEFRRLCLEDHIQMMPERKDEIILRKLRQEVYRNNGQLNILTLRYLYNVLGTKVAMEEFISKAGTEVMGKTLKSIKRIKANALKLNYDKHHGLNLGKGINEVCRVKGVSIKQLYTKMGIDISCHYELESMKDVTIRPEIEQAIQPTIKKYSKALDCHPTFLLFASLEESEKHGMIPEVFKQLFAAMKDVYNNKKLENGKNDESKTA